MDNENGKIVYIKNKYRLRRKLNEKRAKKIGIVTKCDLKHETDHNFIIVLSIFNISSFVDIIFYRHAQE